MHDNRSEPTLMMTINETGRTLTLETSYFIICVVIPYFPLVSTILGAIGFLGNVFTFVQPELHLNSCCVYIFCSSIVDFIHLMINVFPEYLFTRHGYEVPWSYTESLCKLYYFLYNFLPHLAINFLLLSLIDQFTCTCCLTSKMNRFHRLKVVPWNILIVIVVSALLSLYGPILAFRGSLGCTYRQPRVYAILNISINGLLQPILMVIFASLTYRNVRLSRMLVVSIAKQDDRLEQCLSFTESFVQIQREPVSKSIHRHGHCAGDCHRIPLSTMDGRPDLRSLHHQSNHYAGGTVHHSIGPFIHCFLLCTE